MVRSDAWQYLKRMTPLRAWNHFQVYTSYIVSKVTKSPTMWGLPIALAIEPTTACNLGCPECPSGLKQFSRNTGNLDDANFQGWIDQLKRRSSYLTFYFQGEPYIHKNFLEMVSYANSKKMYTATSTNAHFLDDKTAKQTVESGLSRLIISIDGTTQEVYENYRINGDLDKVLQGAKNIISWKKKLKSKTPHVIFQFLVVKPNEHQIPDLYTLAENLGADEVRLKTAQLYDFENGNDLMPSDEQYSRYTKGRDGKYKIKSKLANECWRMWHSCVVTWDGKIVPCCFDKDATHQLGDLAKETFKEVWFGDGYNSFRKGISKSRKEYEICANCSEGSKVWA